ncbi:FG-GAP-like repeat-containing protein [Streptomyces sp. NPDC058486]|uniref:FG-GAP-like repeat-containing protein n=1 Tax=unclassified Streptomyces TaxID=2593676 RepID=UPI00365FD3D3
MQSRSTGTRLASAVTAVLAVTALGAGTLATAPAAFAATSGPVSATQADEALPSFPASTKLSGVGAFGFATYTFAHDGSRVVRWTPFDGGAPVRIDVPEGGDWSLSHGDVLVLSDARDFSEARTLTLRDLSAPGTPDVTIDLAALNGTYVSTLSRTSVLARMKRADGSSELHIVTKDGAHTVDREVTGLPADAADFTGGLLRDGSGAFAVGYEKGPAELRTGGRAVIDPVTGAATETYHAADSGSGWGGPHLSDSHVAWYEWSEDLGSVIRTVDRKTGAPKHVTLGAHGDGWYFSLAGEWLVYGNPSTPAKAVSLATGETVPLPLDSGSVARGTPDGGFVVRGARAADGKGLFRVVRAADGPPTITKVADEVELPELKIQEVHVPDWAELDRTGGKVTLGWTVSRRDAYVDVTLTHTVTERQFHTRVQAPATGNTFSFTWDGVLDDGTDAPNGRYAIEAEASVLDGTSAPVYQGWQMYVTRAANPHDFTHNGSTDVLARDAAGVLWRDDLRDRPVNGKVTSAQRARIGGGWNTYKHIEAAGDLGGYIGHGGYEIGDLVALDGSGVLWSYAGQGDGTFGTRARVGGGWGVYKQLTGGSDLDGDERADLVAADGAGALWFYKGTGNIAKPFGTRVRIGGGWGVYNQLAAVGNIAGSAAGDLVARDTTGVLWLYQGDGKGKFLGRVRVGAGWNAFSQLVGAGDVNGDGRADLLAYGAGGTYVYRSNGTVSGTFTRMNTTLYAGEGSKFTSVS